MIEFIIFTIFSSFEYIAIIMIAFSIYHIRFKKITFHLLFISIALSYVSFTMRNSVSSDSFAPIVQLFVLFLFIWLMFRIQVFYALLITVTGYFSLVIVQGIVIVILDFYGILTFEQLMPNTAIGYYIQLITSALLLVMAAIIEKFNWGFNFVPHSEFAKVRIRNDESVILLIILITISSFLVTYYLIIYNQLLTGYQLMVSMGMIALALLIYFARKKDKKEE